VARLPWAATSRNLSGASTAPAAAWIAPRLSPPRLGLTPVSVGVSLMAGSGLPARANVSFRARRGVIPTRGWCHSEPALTVSF
jgi:hypothetical protein